MREDDDESKKFSFRGDYAEVNKYCVRILKYVPKKIEWTTVHFSALRICAVKPDLDWD